VYGSANFFTRHGTWTQRLPVELLQHVLPENNDSLADEIPGYIIDEFLPFVENVLAEEKGSHVNDAISMIKACVDLRGGSHEIGQKAISTIQPHNRQSRRCPAIFVHGLQRCNPYFLYQTPLHGIIATHGTHAVSSTNSNDA
jgi:hypothetical protein